MALTKLTTDLIEGSLGTDWVSTIQTSNFTAVAGKGYFVNTTSAEITVTLPAGVVGTEIVIQDYAGTFATNKVIFASNGSEKIQGTTGDFRCVTNNATVILIYQDATKGWTSQDISLVPPPLTVDYLVVAGGGAGGFDNAGGGGAGGLRTSYGSNSGGGLTAENSITLTTSVVYSITVGAGGAASGSTDGDSTGPFGEPGNDSQLSGPGLTTITSIGGGEGGSSASDQAGNGGCGGGEYGNGTPSSSSGTYGQGFAGGENTTKAGGGGGGGGTGAVGGNSSTTVGADGGIGTIVNILNSSNATTSSVGEVSSTDVYYGGGGAGGHENGTTTSSTGGLGGGGNSNGINSNTAGTVNTGGGGAGGTHSGNGGKAGGSGVVILRYPSGYTTTVGAGITQALGSPFTEGSNKVSVFTAGTGNIQFN